MRFRVKFVQFKVQNESALLAASLPNPEKLRVDQPSAYMLKRAAWIERQVRQLGGPGYLAR